MVFNADSYLRLIQLKTTVLLNGVRKMVNFELPWTQKIFFVPRSWQDEKTEIFRNGASSMAERDLTTKPFDKAHGDRKNF